LRKKTTEGQMPLAGTEEGQILARLSERVDRAVQTIQELRRERDTLQARLNEVEAQLRDNDGATTRLRSLEEEHDRFKHERGEIRGRIESILSSLETLDGE
jgi:FtsZ-binding cell division protein ZapB